MSLVTLLYLLLCIMCNALDHLKIVSNDKYFSNYANFIDELRDEYTISKLHHPLLSKFTVVAAYLFFFLTLPLVSLIDWLNHGSKK